MSSNDGAATELANLDRAFGVIQSVDELLGWHLVEASLHRPGVYRYMITRSHSSMSYECRRGFVRQEIVTMAVELGYLSKPNGFTLP